MYLMHYELWRAKSVNIHCRSALSVPLSASSPVQIVRLHLVGWNRVKFGSWKTNFYPDTRGWGNEDLEPRVGGGGPAKDRKKYCDLTDFDGGSGRWRAQQNFGWLVTCRWLSTLIVNQTWRESRMKTVYRTFKTQKCLPYKKPASPNWFLVHKRHLCLHQRWFPMANRNPSRRFSSWLKPMNMSPRTATLADKPLDKFKQGPRSMEGVNVILK